MTSTLELKNISIGFGQRTLVRGIQATIVAGELVGIKGRNGCGKTTLLKTVAGLQRPLNGSIAIDGENLTELDARSRAKNMSMVLTQRQVPAGLDVLTLVSMGRFPHASAFGWVSKNARETAELWMDRLSISHFAATSLSNLSDGELQKVMIARALAQESKFVLLDEPTAYLDYVARVDIVQLLQTVAHDHGVGIVFSSHEIELMSAHSDRVLEMSDGKMQEIAP